MMEILIKTDLKLFKNVYKNKYHSITIKNIDFLKFKMNNLVIYRTFILIFN